MKPNSSTSTKRGIDWKDEAYFMKNVLEWIASRKSRVGNRSEHADELIFFAREFLKNYKDNDYWQEVFYSV